MPTQERPTSTEHTPAEEYTKCLAHNQKNHCLESLLDPIPDQASQLSSKAVLKTVRFTPTINVKVHEVDEDDRQQRAAHIKQIEQEIKDQKVDAYLAWVHNSILANCRVSMLPEPHAQLYGNALSKKPSFAVMPTGDDDRIRGAYASLADAFDSPFAEEDEPPHVMSCAGSGGASRGR